MGLYYRIIRNYCCVIDSGVASHPDLIDNLEEGFDFYNNNDLESE